MKYQNFAIIFVIIILPLSMVLSYYIQMQSDTITLQTKYQNKLNDSAYDAIAAYQLNSLNTQRVTGESVKSYVLASVNTFFTTLATNLGMSSASKQYLLPYVPAILFTTYDGYYIYSPLKMEKIAEDPNTGIGVQTKDGDIIYISNAAPKDYRAEEDICEDITENIEQGDNVNTRYPYYTNNKNNAKIEYNYMLKPFIYYSAQYKDGNKYDFVASYTLDNYVTLYGKRDRSLSAEDRLIPNGTDEFSKSGYLIDPTKITLGGNILLKGVTRRNDTYSGISVSTSEPSENGQATYTAAINANMGTGTSANHVRYRAIDITSPEAYNYINYYYYGEENDDNGYFPSRVTTQMHNPIRYQTGDNIIESTLEIEEQINDNRYNVMTESNVNTYLLSSGTYRPITVQYNGVEITDLEAKEYYIKAYFFSTWVQNNLSNVTAASIIQNDDIIKEEGPLSEVRYEYTDFVGDNRNIFNIRNNPDNDPEKTDSYMSDHKRAVIKNSIQFNLNTAISTYDATRLGNQEFQMPIMRTEDWDNILNNVSMTAFMQGMPCGLTTFNSYTVVKSNNNNTSASLENIYFTKEIGTDNQSKSYYHKYDCDKLQDNNSFPSWMDPLNQYYLSDLSAEFKYDAKKINVRVKSTAESDTIVCLFDDSTNAYYTVKQDTVDNIGVISIGERIPNTQLRSCPELTTYKQNSLGEWEKGTVSGIDLTSLPNSSEVLYIYDHQNLGCYDCIVSGQYTPVVKFFRGELRRMYLTDRGEALIAIEEGGVTTFYYEDGGLYNGTPTPDITNTIDNGFLVTRTELDVRRRTIYTAIAKQRNSLYKTNDYVNR